SNISSATVIEIARSCPNLVYLNLNGQPFINDESICAIARSCVNLQHLDLLFNEIIMDEAICAIATGCPDMRNYFLKDYNAICDIVRSCSNIQNLSFQYIYITDKTIYEITHHCSNLLVLNAKKCLFISDESIYFLLSKKPVLELILDW
ncbi:24360_t:CDS:2, partial [Entrophospora sp. SA101]